jgi:branched-chain amino acid transport system ATP-binding protein
MLKIERLQASYGGSLVLQGIDLKVQEGHIVAIMGRNGVGKTTLMKSVVGLVKPRSGCVLFNGKNITGMAPHQISNLGISYVPQGKEIFQFFTVYENLRLGIVRYRRKERIISQEILDYFPILKERGNQRAGSLSGGEQQMLAIARALVSSPTILFLDEPSEGIQPSIVEEIREILLRINREKGVTILMVEQNIDLVMDVSEECFFMEKGKIMDWCKTGHLRQDDHLITQYLAL